MTNELEKKFFDTFGIKQKLPCDTSCYVDDGVHCYGCTKGYPLITDHILLELICILNNYGKNDTWAISVENLKDCILINCIKVIKEKDLKEMPLNNFKHQICTLFKES